MLSKESADDYGVLNFAGSLKNVPGDLNGILNQDRCRMFSMVAKRSEAASVPGRLCDLDAGTTVLAPGLRTEGASMSNDDHNPMTEHQATDLKVTAKLKRRRYEPGLSKQAPQRN